MAVHDVMTRPLLHTGLLYFTFISINCDIQSVLTASFDKPEHNSQ